MKKIEPGKEETREERVTQRGDAKGYAEKKRRKKKIVISTFWNFLFVHLGLGGRKVGERKGKRTRMKRREKGEKPEEKGMKKFVRFQGEILFFASMTLLD